jgi:hypothetical protein
MNKPLENGKLFGLRIWQALLVFTLGTFLGMFTIVAMREGLGWPVPEWVGGGLGGLFGYFGVVALAARKRARQPDVR